MVNLIKKIWKKNNSHKDGNLPKGSSDSKSDVKALSYDIQLT